MSNSKIIYIGGFKLPDKNAAAHRVLANAKLFKTLGYDTIFVGVSDSKDNKVIHEDCLGFDSWSLQYPQNIWNWIRYLTSIKDVLNIISKYDNVKLIVCYNYQAIAFVKLLHHCRKRNIKIIADCTEWYGLQGENIFKAILKGFDSFLRMRLVHKRVDGLIVISNFLFNYYSDIKNVILLPPLIDISDDKWHMKRTGASKNNNIKLIYSGNPSKVKDNIDKLINCLYAFDSSFKYELKIVGISEEQYRKMYNASNKLEIPPEIKFLGRVSHMESIKYIVESDFSIFFREDNIVHRAGFPTKLVESLACGVPVITNKTSDISEYITSGYNGYILNDNICQQLAEIIHKPYEEFDSLRINVDSKVFDYHNYIKIIEYFIANMIN